MLVTRTTKKGQKGQKDQLWYQKKKILPGNVCFSVVIVLCCQVENSPTNL
jgi:hypothetical protein